MQYERINKKVVLVISVVALLSLSMLSLINSYGQNSTDVVITLSGYAYNTDSLDINSDVSTQFYPVYGGLEGQVTISGATYEFTAKRLDKTKTDNGIMERFNGELQNSTTTLRIRMIKVTSNTTTGVCGSIYRDSDGYCLGYSMGQDSSRIRQALEEAKVRKTSGLQEQVPASTSTTESKLTQEQKHHTVYTEGYGKASSGDGAVMFVSTQLEPYFMDDFSGDLSKWTNTANWAIESGELSHNVPYEDVILANDVSMDDASIEATITFKGSGDYDSNLILRYKDGNNFYVGGTWPYGASIWKKLNGNWIQLANANQNPLSISQNVPYKYRFAVKGNQLALYRDDKGIQPMAQVTDNSITGFGQVGMRVYPNPAHVHFDNVYVGNGDWIWPKQSKSTYITVYADGGMSWPDGYYCDYAEVNVESFTKDLTFARLEFADPYPLTQYGPWSISISVPLVPTSPVGPDLGVSYTPTESEFRWDTSYGYQRAHWAKLTPSGSSQMKNMKWIDPPTNQGFNGICAMLKAIPGIRTSGTQVQFTASARIYYCFYADGYGWIYLSTGWAEKTATLNVKS